MMLATSCLYSCTWVSMRSWGEEATTPWDWNTRLPWRRDWMASISPHTLMLMEKKGEGFFIVRRIYVCLRERERINIVPMLTVSYLTSVFCESDNELNASKVSCNNPLWANISTSSLPLLRWAWHEGTVLLESGEGKTAHCPLQYACAWICGTRGHRTGMCLP